MKKWYKLCPYCAEEIRDNAVKCRFCWEFLWCNKGNNQFGKEEGEYERVRVNPIDRSYVKLNEGWNKWWKIWTGWVILIILWIIALLCFVFWMLVSHRETDEYCVEVYNGYFQYRFWADIKYHEVKYSEIVNGCVAYIETQQFTKNYNFYLLEYEVYIYTNRNFNRLFSKYISIPNLNSSINERNDMSQEVYDYYNNNL